MLLSPAHSLPATILIGLLRIPTLTRAQQVVQLINPPPGKAGTELSYAEDHKIHIQWSSTYPIITTTSMARAGRGRDKSVQQRFEHAGSKAA